MKNKNITIIGAGVTGLVAGYRLSQSGYKVTIYEKSKDIGGLLGGFKIGSVSLEKTYHHIFKTDKYIIDLIAELGLKNKLKWHPEKTALYYDQKIYPFMGIMDLLKFKPLNLIDKLRLGLVKIWLQKDNNWEKYKSITAANWMKKWCGEQAYGVIWEPLLKGKFHQFYDQVSMAWLWARIHTRGNSGELGYLDGGFGQITDELAKRIKEKGGKIILNTEYNPSKSPNDLGDFDNLIFTGASSQINYLGAICVVFASKQSLSPYYWHNINDTKSPFLAFIQHTNLVDRQHYGNKNVYYLGTYLPHKHRYFTDSDAKILKIFFDYLKKIYPKFDKDLIDKTWVYKLKNAQHIVGTDYQIPKPTLPSLDPDVSGQAKGGKNRVYVANFAQIFPEDRGINFAVREGEKVAASFQ